MLCLGQREGTKMTRRMRIKSDIYLVLYYDTEMKYGDPMTGKNTQIGMLTR